jgi:hypothetical protein
MRRIATVPETIVYLILVVVGACMVHDGSLSTSSAAQMTVIAGAICFVFSAGCLVSAIRSILWHRQMLRHSSHRHRLS